MATTIPSAALVPVAPVFTNTERLALARFLAAYGGLTRQAYELLLRQFASWCQQHQLRLFQARRADIEFFARDLEARADLPAGLHRRGTADAAAQCTPVPGHDAVVLHARSTSSMWLQGFWSRMRALQLMTT
jgi:hypothetical protein